MHLMDFQLPELGEGVYEVEFLTWKVQVGDTVKSGQALMEVMTDKATMEVPAPFAGTITELKVEPNTTLKIGNTILSYDPAGKAVAVATSPSKAETESTQLTSTDSNHRLRDTLGIKASPTVRQMARTLNIDLHEVQGTGPKGRILIEDVSGHVQDNSEPSKPKKVKRPKFDYGQPGETIKLQGMRKAIAEQMVKSKSTIPHYSYIEECDVTELVKLRTALRDHFAGKNQRLTYLPFFLKAISRAMKEIPIINATMDEGKQEVHLHESHNIGVAVASPQGLIVPVIKNVESKSIEELTAAVSNFDEISQTGRVSRASLQGGTFTMTSIGSIGGMFSTPVINHPEVAILGIGKIVRRPMFDEHDNVVPAHLVYLSLSFDHRVVDGAIGAEFTNAIIRHLQQPATLLLAED